MLDLVHGVLQLFAEAATLGRRYRKPEGLAIDTETALRMAAAMVRRVPIASAVPAPVRARAAPTPPIGGFYPYARPRAASSAASRERPQAIPRAVKIRCPTCGAALMRKPGLPLPPCPLRLALLTLATRRGEAARLSALRRQNRL